MDLKAPLGSRVESSTERTYDAISDVSSISSVAQEQLNFDKEQAARAKNVALAKATSCAASIQQDLADLNSEYTEHFNWLDADDADVEKAVKNIKSWKDKFSRIRKDALELEGIVSGEDLTDLSEKMARLKIQVTKTSTELQEAIDSIREADTEKSLFTERKDRIDPPLYNSLNFLGLQGKTTWSSLRNLRRL